MHGKPDALIEAHPSDAVHHRLLRIADVLACPMSDFFGSAASRPDLGGAAELLALWSALSNEADRARLLACAREAVSVDEVYPAAGG